jgi:hypothetical protein
LKSEATAIIATNAAQIERLRSTQNNFEKDVSVLEKTMDSDQIEIKLLQNQIQEQDRQSSVLKSKCDVARGKCFSKLHETEATERQIASKLLAIFDGQASSDTALKSLVQERSTRERKFEDLLETLKIAELEANLAGNARAGTLDMHRVLEELERKHEIAALENEKLMMKLPKMEKMLSQKAHDIEEAHGQAAAKILQLQQEGSTRDARCRAAHSCIAQRKIKLTCCRVR